VCLSAAAAAVAGNYADFIAFKSEQKAAAAGGDAGELQEKMLSAQPEHAHLMHLRLYSLLAACMSYIHLKA
jgi:hypothetical protein